MTANRHRADLAVMERRQLLARERHVRAKAEETAVEAGMQETATLYALKGVEIQRTPQKRGEKRKPMQRPTGLGFLLERKKITQAQYEAGEKYGAVFRLAAGEATIRSILNDERGGGSFNVNRVLAQAERSAQAQAVLSSYRQQLGNQAALVDACDQVCGEERTPRECSPDGHRADALEAVLKVALDLLTTSPSAATV